MKDTWRKWLVTGTLVTTMLAAAVIPALAQDTSASDANLARGLTLGMILLGIVVILGVGAYFYINENGGEDN